MTKQTKQPERKLKVFDHIQNWEPSLWQRIRLFFKKPHIICDYGYGKDKSVELTFKTLGDRIFLIKEKTL